MTAIQLLEKLGANPSFEIDDAVRQQVLDQLDKAPSINFIGIFPGEEEEKQDDDDDSDDQQEEADDDDSKDKDKEEIDNPEKDQH